MIPVDFSKQSEKALLFAAGLSKSLGMDLFIVHVVHDPAEDPGYYRHRHMKKLARRIEDDAQEMMTAFLEKIVRKNPKIPELKKAEVAMVVGLPITRIIELSEQSKPHMIVMGSQGRTGLSRILLGSKAEGVLRLAKVPVTIVK